MKDPQAHWTLPFLPPFKDFRNELSSESRLKTPSYVPKQPHSNWRCACATQCSLLCYSTLQRKQGKLQAIAWRSFIQALVQGEKSLQRKQAVVVHPLSPQLLRPDCLDLTERTPDSQETWFVSPPWKCSYYFALLAGETPPTKQWSVSAHITTEFWAKQKKFKEIRRDSVIS